MVTIAFSIVSCKENQPPPYKTRRVEILENNTISFVHIPRSLDSVYKTYDTVWVNLVTHRIDDSDSLTMMGVIK